MGFCTGHEKRVVAKPKVQRERPPSYTDLGNILRPIETEYSGNVDGLRRDTMVDWPVSADVWDMLIRDANGAWLPPVLLVNPAWHWRTPPIVLETLEMKSSALTLFCSSALANGTAAASSLLGTGREAAASAMTAWAESFDAWPISDSGCCPGASTGAGPGSGVRRRRGPNLGPDDGAAAELLGGTGCRRGVAGAFPARDAARASWPLGSDVSNVVAALQGAGGRSQSVSSVADWKRGP